MDLFASVVAWKELGDTVLYAFVGAMAVSLAKARATATAQLAVQEGVQMHGGIGMTDAFDMGFFMKRARVAAEWLGDYGYHANIVAQARGF